MDAQDEYLDHCQMHALRYIYGKDMSYAKIREKAGVSTLRARREELCDKFRAKFIKRPRFQHWFLKKLGRVSRRGFTKSSLQDAKGSITCLYIT